MSQSQVHSPGCKTLQRLSQQVGSRQRFCLVLQIHHEELENSDKEWPSAFPKIKLKQTDSGIQQLLCYRSFISTVYPRKGAGTQSVVRLLEDARCLRSGSPKLKFP
jgi:hypothetical protein